jgi:hypothetical protein
MPSSEVYAQQLGSFLQERRAQGKHSAPALIERAYGQREITIDQWALYQTYALFDPAKLPAKYCSTVPEKCGTWILDEIYQHWNKLSEQTKRMLMTYGFRSPGILQRPAWLDSTRSTDHFMIHYSVAPGDTDAVNPSDGNGNGTPDYVDNMMAVLEEVWNTEITAMGYVAPPPDGGFGGDSKCDIFLLKLAPTYYGLTVPEDTVGDNPNSPGIVEQNVTTSFLLLRNNYNDFPEQTELQHLQVTIAHEFYHAIQHGYNAFEKPWMKEATAAWCEDEVFDNVNRNYYYLPLWFANPWISLDADPRTADITYEGHWYGSWIFFRYISEHVGGRNTVRRIWERSRVAPRGAPERDFKAIEEALNEQGTNFRDVFRLFTTANFVRTIPPYDYEEGANYPEIEIKELLVGDKTVIDGVSRRACRYIRVSPNLIPRGTDIINFTFEPLDPATRFGVQVVTRTGNVVKVNTFATNFSLTNTQGMDEIVVIVMNFDALGTTNLYRLRVQTNSALHRISWKPVRHRFGETLTLSKGWISWEGMDGEGYLYDGYHGINTRTLGFMRAVVHNRRAAWLDSKWWDDVTSTVVVQYFDGISVRTIGSRSWTVFLDRLGVFPGHRLAIYDQRIAIPIRFLRNPPFESNDDDVALCISENGADPVPITPRFRVADYYGVHVHQLNRRDAIWSLKPYAPSPDTVFWYRDYFKRNERPPTRFPDTVPKLEGDTLAWFESKSANPDSVRNDVTYEMFYHDGRPTYHRTYQLTNDNVRDAGYYDDFDLVGGVTNGRIAWLRYSEKPWWGGGLFIAYYDGSGIKFLVDTLNFVPRADHIVKIDPVKGFVAWYGYGGNPPSFDPLNIWLYDGVGIQPIVPPTFQIAAEAMAINDGQIAFAAWPQQGGDLAIYLYTHEPAITSVADRGDVLPQQFTLFQNYPNPFNPSTTIRFAIPQRSHVTLKVFDILGREVTTLVDEWKEAGTHNLTFDSASGIISPFGILSSGVYFYRLQAGGFIETKKLLVLK